MFSKKTIKKLKKIGHLVKQGVHETGKAVHQTARTIDVYGGKVHKFAAPIARGSYEGFRTHEIPEYRPRRRNINRMLTG